MSTPAGRTTVVVADDHPIYRAAVAGAIGERSDLELLAVCTSGRDAVAQILGRQPTVAVLEVRMRDLDGIAVLAEIARAGSPTRVVFLSGFEHGAFVHAAMTGGAVGYVSKEVDRTEICDAITAAANDERVIRLSSVITARHRRAGRRRCPPLSFSRREEQVIRLAVDGLAVPQIAETLGVSINTVKTHMERVYRKLGVTDRAALAATALRGGLVR
jgi:two-component system, NarL family, nitrate/nitrite response regulator NarL